jgi:hypothetical protein
LCHNQAASSLIDVALFVTDCFHKIEFTIPYTVSDIKHLAKEFGNATDANSTGQIQELTQLGSF